MGTNTRSILTRAAALTPIGRAYARAAWSGEPAGFVERALAELGVGSAVDSRELDRVPDAGPLVVVANHPYGALDGLLLLDLVGRRRRDVKLLGNRLLSGVAALGPCLLHVDVLGKRPAAVARNASAVRGALRWLARGGCVALFPAGEVAHAIGEGGRVIDSAWQVTAAELAARARARVVPVFFDGGNSGLFRAAGRVHPLLRTALLPREMWLKRGSTIAVRIGEPVEAAALRRLPDGEKRTRFLRGRVEALATQHPGAGSGPPSGALPSVAIATRGPVRAIQSDIDSMQASVLLESGDFQVFFASARELPAVLPEIGRLREIAFRQAGEGTGRPRDLDSFDETYQHLFVWDRARREVAGGYRLGATDVVAAGGRVEGLYTRTLFDYDAALLEQIGPALELGRSFVAPAYQRDFSPLLLLWKGISRVVARSPRYRRLFGVVSISDRYDSSSRQLLATFLQTRRFDADLGRLVRAKRPPPIRGGLVESTTVASLAEVSSLVRRIEADGKDIPVLLRQYLKLNARFMGFSIDPSFGNVLDGLVIVDLAEVEPAILVRYMGRAEARAFLEVVRGPARDELVTIPA